jgi:predicted ATP-dependent endonuclease of OLD family
MKIRKIQIKDFHQFKNLELDLTYPKGHPLEHRPLRKVCFIGQSGTGKTSILEIIPRFLSYYNCSFINKIGDSAIIDKIIFDISFGFDNEYTASVGFSKSEDTGRTTRNWDALKINNEEPEFEKFLEYYKSEWTKTIASKIIYFPANLNYEIDPEPANLSLESKAIVDFSKEKVSSVWSVLLESIKNYQEIELQLRQEISKTIEQDSVNVETINNAVNKLIEWKKNHFNPIQDLASNCLDRLLAHFKLKVKTELDIKSKEDIGFIKIEDFNKNEIPNGLWSTGTKQVVLSSMPLYLLKPKHTVLLFDEPERSLYPDLQRLIVDFYSSFTTDCQFFYSTHSPIIASCFEPWEIIELKFNENGEVYRELYYEGDNHVANYKLDPRFMRWDDILQRIFDMSNDGSDLRKEKLNELALKNVELRKMESDGKGESRKAKQLKKQILQLSNELSYWN